MMNSMIKSLWLIPARGGSKGIPGKNNRPFLGIPLVCRAVMQAQECAESDDVVFVSTDSPEIKEVALSCGDVVPFMRPPTLASDTSSTYDAILHALREFRDRGLSFQRVMLLQPTSPLRTTDDIRHVADAWSPRIDMAVSVCEARSNPYYNAFECDEAGFLHVSKGDGKFSRRQDAPKVWEYNGAVYAISVPSLLKGPFSTFTRIIPVEMPANRSVDLDTPLDWTIAEALASQS